MIQAIKELANQLGWSAENGYNKLISKGDPLFGEESKPWNLGFLSNLEMLRSFENYFTLILMLLLLNRQHKFSVCSSKKIGSTCLKIQLAVFSITSWFYFCNVIELSWIAIVLRKS